MTDTSAHLIEMVDRMPAFPRAVSRILEMTASSTCAPKDLVKVIEHDPVMTMKVLKLVNSAHFGLATPVSSINQGVVLVGINTIKNLALAIAAMGVLPKDVDSGLNMDRFLLHSLGVATVARILAQRLGVSDRDSTDYFVAGLLHDFGKVVLAQFMAEDYRQALARAADGKTSLRRAERDILGVDHTELGGLLAESWKLSPILVAGIRGHHGQATDDAGLSLRDCVYAANQIVRFYKFGDSGNHVLQSLPSGIQTRFGADLPTLIKSLGDLRPDLDKARIFTQL